MNSSAHPTERALKHFVLGDLGAGDTRDVVRHLLTGCEQCREVTSRLWPVHRDRYDPQPLERLDVRVDDLRKAASRVELERQASHALFEELEVHAVHRRTLLALNSRRFQTYAVVERVLEKVHELGFQDPTAGREWAELALALAERVPPQRYGAALVHDLLGRAWGSLGNARRQGSDLQGASDAFDKADEELAQGTGDPLEAARLCSLRASLCKLQRETIASARLFDKAASIYRRVGEHHLMGCAMVDKAAALSTAGDYAGAVRAVEAGLEHIDPEIDPRVALAAKHALSLHLHREGDIDRSMALLQEILPAFSKQNDAMVLLRLRWLEGRLAQAQGRRDRAEEAFREVQRGFSEREIPYEAASVSFDLATILVEEQRYEELAELAAEILSVFSRLGVPRETLAALELFQAAVAAQQVSAAWIGELSQYLSSSRATPGMPFEPSS